MYTWYHRFFALHVSGQGLAGTNVRLLRYVGGTALSLQPVDRDVTFPSTSIVPLAGPT